MAKKEFDIKKVFEDTLKGFNNDLVATNARIGLITELVNFFETNKLVVYQEVEEESKAKKEEK